MIEAPCQVIVKGPVTVDYTKMVGVPGKMKVETTDTPGVPDTEGRAVDFLDKIMMHCRSCPLHGIVWVVDANGRFSADLQMALKAAKECWNGQLTESRLIVYVNKVPNAFSFRGHPKDEVRQKQEEKVSQAVEYVVSYLLGPEKVAGFQNFVWNEQGSHAGVEFLKLAIAKLPSMPLGATQLKAVRTWTEIKKYYDGVLNGALKDKADLMLHARHNSESFTLLFPLFVLRHQALQKEASMTAERTRRLT